MPKYQITKRNNQLAKLEPTLARNSELVLADLSSSMNSEIPTTGLSKWDCLKSALIELNQNNIIGFASGIVEVTNAHQLPRPGGSTNLAGALHHAIVCEPIGVLVVSDGVPNNALSALEVAAQLSKDCIINVLYIGDSFATAAKDFMRELASVGRGRYQEYDLMAAKTPKQLGSSISSLLMLPPPNKIDL